MTVQKQDVLVIDDIMRGADSLGSAIADFQYSWDTARHTKIEGWKETQKYVFATDTNDTSNNKLPWSNKTTLPKLCQIRDNLVANYMSTLFPKRKWPIWEGNTEDDETIAKKRAIESYILWTMDRNQFYQEASRLVHDYVDYGNCFATVEWVDTEQVVDDGPVGSVLRAGYVGPSIRRISPYDIVFNPIASSFETSPKIIRALVSKGDLSAIINRDRPDTTDPEGFKETQDILKYMEDFRGSFLAGDFSEPKDEAFQIQGFDSFQTYLSSDVVEVLTFYGDIYDSAKDTFHRNKIIKIVDRHKVISMRDNPSLLGMAPIYHAGWRIRSDNLWAMGPLDNLIGMQYRIDHLENIKADVFDLIAYPVVKVRGTDVEEFDWSPLEKIYVGKDDVDIVSPDANALRADSQIALLKQEMEEAAGSPREAAGFRTPGEKTKFEIQSLASAASRIYTHKITQIEREIFEPLLNAKLELARRNMSKPTTIRSFDEETKVSVFETLTAADITGSGRIRPVAARHFSEQSQKLQDLNTFFSGKAGSDPEVLQHFGSVRLSKIYEGLIGLEDDNIVEPFVRISERADAQRLESSQQEQVQMEGLTPSGLFEGDIDENQFQDPEDQAGLDQEQEDQGGQGDLI